MQKIVIRNKFRIVNADTGEVIRLNVKPDVNGVYRFVSGFNSITDAKKNLELYKRRFNGNFVIESYPVTAKHEIEQQDAETNAALAQLKVFSGKGLQYNTLIPHKEENRYQPHKYYGKDVWMYQTTERGKGKSVNKNGSKSRTHHKAKSLSKYHNLTMLDCIILDIKDNMHKFPNRKALHQYLRDRKMSWKQVKEITSKVHN